MALHHLVRHLRERGFALFDIQMVTPATKPLGAIEIPRCEYVTKDNSWWGVKLLGHRHPQFATDFLLS